MAMGILCCERTLLLDQQQVDHSQSAAAVSRVMVMPLTKCTDALTTAGIKASTAEQGG